MTKRKRPFGVKGLTFNVPIDLADSFHKTCIDFQMTKTEAILRYLEYLRKTHKKDRRLLDEDSDPDSFRLEY